MSLEGTVINGAIVLDGDQKLPAWKLSSCHRRQKHWAAGRYGRTA